MNKYATFFGGAINDTSTIEYKESILLGEYLAQNGFIVKCGGYKGLMEAVSLGVHNKSGKVIGYTCKTFPSIIGNIYLSETIVCDDIFQRLKFLIEDSEIFIVQRGGLGTLSELFLLLDIIRKNKIKPKIFLIGDCYIDFWNTVKPLINNKEHNIITLIKNVDELKSTFF